MALLDRFKSLLASQKLDVKARFELLREAISGSMSKFYMAQDRNTGDVVGLKILDRLKTKQFEARFKGLKKPTEGEIALQFDHPYIVKTLEHGATTDGSQYLVMEYLEGVGMNWALMSRDPILDGRRVRFIRQVAEALAAVHEAGFIHRDVCPRNLIFTGDGQTLKLTDFGLTVPATRQFMQPGNRTGTPEYMAPELVRRFATDQRLDVFAFGATVYEIFAGELPWPRTRGGAPLIHTRQSTDIHQFRPQINPDLAKAIHSCIEADVKDRCPSMEEFLRAIRRVEHDDVEQAGG